MVAFRESDALSLVRTICHKFKIHIIRVSILSFQSGPVCHEAISYSKKFEFFFCSEQVISNKKGGNGIEFKKMFSN